MPIYEFQCEKCDTIFEELRKRSDKSPATCSCGSEETRRIMSNTAFQLKGGGWYVTDYDTSVSPTKPASEKAAEAAESTKSSDTATTSDNTTSTSGTAATPAPSTTSETKTTKSDSSTTATSSND